MTRPHVIPVGNGEPIHTAHARCWCQPFDASPLEVVTHNSADKREQFERQGHIKPGNLWVIVNEDISE